MLSLKRYVHLTGAITCARTKMTLRAIIGLLKKSKKQPIILWINSPGGNASAAFAFYDTIKNVLRPNLITICAGEASSAAVLFFLAGQERLVLPNSYLYIHQVHCWLGGATSEVREQAKVIELLQDNYAKIVAETTNDRISRKMALAMMARDTLVTAEQAVATGLAHGIITEPR